MDDVTVQNPVSETIETQGEQTPAPQGETNAPATGESQIPGGVVPEKTIPYARFKEVNDRLREIERAKADLESQRNLSQYSEEDLNSVMNHPFVQKLQLEAAKRDLVDFAKETLNKPQYAGISPQVKKAITSNVRGFVKESTTDVETAKIDLQEYLDNILEEVQAGNTPTQKSINVAATNTSASTKGVTPEEVQSILDKPVTDWTAEEIKAVEVYTKSQKKKSK